MGSIGIAYCGNNPGNAVDPSGTIRVAFYNGRARGSQDYESAYGDQLHEAADDALLDCTNIGEWVRWTFKDAPFFDMCFDMHSSQEVLKILGILVYRFRVVIDEVYFFDHSAGDGEEGFGTDNLGNPDFLSGTALETFCRELSQYVAVDGTIHFRQCFVASALNFELLPNLARWTGRKVTGCPTNVFYGMCPIPYIGNYEPYTSELPVPCANGPDYQPREVWTDPRTQRRRAGEYWLATPNPDGTVDVSTYVWPVGDFGLTY